MLWHIHRPDSGPVLVQYSLSNDQQVDVWVNAAAISEGGFIVNEIFNEHEYLKHGIILRPGDTVIDVGANTGIFGARVLSLVPGGDVRYIGVEPCPNNFQVLQQNLLGQDCRGQQNSMFHINRQLSAPLQPTPEGQRTCPAYPDNITLVQQALSSSSGTCSITYYPHMPGNSTLRPKEKQQLQEKFTPAKYFESAEVLQVRVSTLQQLMDSLDLTGTISLLKIDVEGEELEVLRGLDASGWQRVQQVALEVHDCCSSSMISGCVPNAAPSSLVTSHSTTSTTPTPTATPNLPKHLQPRCLVHPGTVPSSEQLPPNDGGRSTTYEHLMNMLPGARTGRDIDGVDIVYKPLSLQTSATESPAASTAAVAASGAAAEAATAAVQMVPCPQDDGRTMAVAKLLRSLGFKVVIECPFGLPVNYSVYARRGNIR